LKYTAVILTKKKVLKHFHPWAGVRCLRITPRTQASEITWVKDRKMLKKKMAVIKNKLNYFIALLKS
jgi:hypothetical protein